MYSRGCFRETVRDSMNCFVFVAICKNYNYCCITGELLLCKIGVKDRPCYRRGHLSPEPASSAITLIAIFGFSAGAYPTNQECVSFPVSNSAEPVFPAAVYRSVRARNLCQNPQRSSAAPPSSGHRLQIEGLPADEGRNFLTVWPPTFST